MRPSSIPLPERPWTITYALGYSYLEAARRSRASRSRPRSDEHRRASGELQAIRNLAVNLLPDWRLFVRTADAVLVTDPPEPGPDWLALAAIEVDVALHRDCACSDPEYCTRGLRRRLHPEAYPR